MFRIEEGLREVLNSGCEEEFGVRRARRSELTFRQSCGALITVRRARRSELTFRQSCGALITPTSLRHLCTFSLAVRASRSPARAPAAGKHLHHHLLHLSSILLGLLTSGSHPVSRACALWHRLPLRCHPRWPPSSARAADAAGATLLPAANPQSPRPSLGDLCLRASPLPSLGPAALIWPLACPRAPSSPLPTPPAAALPPSGRPDLKRAEILSSRPPRVAATRTKARRPSSTSGDVPPSSRPSSGRRHVRRYPWSPW
ncbi:hypothetical protein ACMD2_26629 [Ananas comosus]|uniref:Uncharacterized protein n=1 Tax=Ananas comosus TaxID=4615 RepID=A0A199UIZ4_ANACO|nr:hypothetical protein ACMD2_26629 [Ananas comosus]